MRYNPLTAEEKNVIENKGTEAPFTGEYDDFYKDGVFVCRKCNAVLFSSQAKFDAGCGWPAFDENFPNAVKRIPDTDGKRVEIVCANCLGHLGHVFEGEHLTDKNTRHCVNSLSIRFVPKESAILAGGCFWCTEAIFKRLKGVTSVLPGYAGGTVDHPSYEQVCLGNTGHAEAVRVEFNPELISFEKILDVFWHTHNPTTLNRQGSDMGTQYRSVIFYHNQKQKEIAEKSKGNLEKEQLYQKPVVTEITPFTNFFVAEDYHKNYFDRNKNQPYCQLVINPKIRKLEKLYPN
jgi:peptide methionine sulfoxide reductase msrA/msrB